MILLLQCIVSFYSIIILLYLMFYRVSMQICGYDAFVIVFFSFTCMILYHIMILVSSLSLSIDPLYQLFTCMIQLIILALWLAESLGSNYKSITWNLFRMLRGFDHYQDHIYKCDTPVLSMVKQNQKADSSSLKK
jgi:hypothetical protein